jgi:hypothetical protein
VEAFLAAIPGGGASVLLFFTGDGNAVRGSAQGMDGDRWMTFYRKGEKRETNFRLLRRCHGRIQPLKLIHDGAFFG